MSDKCARCKGKVEHNDNIIGYSYWGIVQTTTETIERKSVRIASTTIRHEDRSVMRSDDETPLCDPCFGLLVGRFLQGRDVVALNHEHRWTQLPKFPILDRCSLCYQTRISDASPDPKETP